MLVVLMIPTLFPSGGILWLATFLGGGISSTLSASSKILPLSTVKGVYFENRLPRLSLRLSLLWPDRPWHSFSSFPFSPLASNRAWLRNSLSSSSCMNLAALFLSSSKLVADYIQRLSANGPGRKVVSMWCIATSGLRFQMLIATLLNLSTKVLKDSSFSWRMPTRAMEVRWCGRLVANCLELGYERCEAVNGFGREFGEPTKGSSLRERGEHSAQYRVFRHV